MGSQLFLKRELAFPDQFDLFQELLVPLLELVELVQKEVLLGQLLFFNFQRSGCVFESVPGLGKLLLESADAELVAVSLLVELLL